MEQVNEYLKRLQLSGSVSSQALEYYRLSEVKCPRKFTPSCLAVICIELSCSKLRVPLDKVKDLLYRNKIYSIISCHGYNNAGTNERMLVIIT